MSEIMKPTVDEAATRPEGKRSVGRSLIRVAQRIAWDRPLLLIVLILLLSIWMTIVYPESFPHWPNFAAVLLDAAQSGILTVGMMILLIGGVFDLSVGSTLAFA